MSSIKTWTLKFDDGNTEGFQDLRRKVGNRVLRAYLLETIVSSERISCQKISIRGPKNEFKDFAKFLIVKMKNGESEYRILAEAGVYENLRIVGTDSEELTKKSRDEVIKIFTDALQEPEVNNTKLILSNDSEVK